MACSTLPLNTSLAFWDDQGQMLRSVVLCALHHCTSSCLRWSGTQSSAPGSLRTSSLHVLSVLKQSGTNTNEYGPMHTVLSHISCVLRWSGNSFIHSGTFPNRDIFICRLRPRQGSIFIDTLKQTLSQYFKVVILSM